MNLDRSRAAAFADRYGQTWESWDVEGFVELFSDDVVYVVHPEEIVVGRAALRRYVRKEKVAQGEVSVRMGAPIVELPQVVAEFWVTATNGSELVTMAGCLVARLDADGRCTHFCEYWFDLAGHRQPFEGWGFDSAPATRTAGPASP